MKKGSFYTQIIENGDVYAVLVDGWIDGNVGYYNKSKNEIGRWYAIDLASGLSINSLSEPTRADAIACVKGTSESMERRRSTPEYQRAVEQLRRLIDQKEL